MPSKEDAIRIAARNLKKAIDTGSEDGLVVTWPNTINGLDALAVSQAKTAPSPQPIPTGPYEVAETASQLASSKKS